MLNPDFAIFDIHMKDTSMNPAHTVPADVHQFKVIPLIINHDLGFDLAMRRTDRILTNESIHDGSVLVGSIHRTTLA